MAILRAYFDDSRTDDADSFRVIAGYASTIPKWGALSVEWNRCLTEWGLEFFHMTDAESLTGHYREWRDLRDTRIGHLSKLVGQFAEVGMVHVVPGRLFDELIIDPSQRDEELRGAMTDVYQYSFMQVLHWMLQLCDDQHIAPSNVELVFEQQGHVGNKARDMWREVWEPAGLPEPDFKPKKGFPPLQAADMLAWRVSRDKTRPHEPVPERHAGLRRRGWSCETPPEAVDQMRRKMERAISHVKQRWANGRPEDPIRWSDVP